MDPGPDVDPEPDLELGASRLVVFFVNCLYVEENTFCDCMPSCLSYFGTIVYILRA